MMMEGFQATAAEPSVAADQQFHLVANSLAKLLDTATRELERDRDVAKASLVTASHILQAEIERCSGANGARYEAERARRQYDARMSRSQLESSAILLSAMIRAFLSASDSELRTECHDGHELHAQ
jgi:hypothetical protein